MTTQKPKSANTRNYQRELDRLLEQLADAPRLLLHSCCAPCSSYVLEYLRKYFAITVFYYNPNISMEAEYRRRVAEQKRLIDLFNQLPDSGHSNSVIEGDYEPDAFYAAAKGLERCPEGGERCFACYELRLRRTAALAKTQGQDYFATTLTISPLKNAARLNEIGERLAQEYQISWLPSDFKKKDGYKRSIALSAKYGLYRQNYCGCVYSQAADVREMPQEAAAHGSGAVL
ncbi:MAG: epoxyqueuosine reductase QueH [Lachnospiraceae bacterium]|nr:epoxyqueuosine reductase QueH [Lachnospiraceae bacterium]